MSAWFTTFAFPSRDNHILSTTRSVADGYLAWGWILPAVCTFVGSVALPITATLDAKEPAKPKQAIRQAQPTAATAAAPGTPEIVAVVNGHPITKEYLVEECLRRYGEKVLESQVNKHLILQECERRGISVSAQEIHEEVKRIATQFNLPVERWYALLQKERDVAPRQYRRDIIWPTLALRKLSRDQLVITSEDLEEAFQADYGPRVQVRLIAVRSKAKAEKLHQQAVANPALFERLAKDHSEDEASASVRGLVPPIRRHVGDPEIEAVAFRMKPNEISPIIAMGDQFMMLKCERRIPAIAIEPEQKDKLLSQMREALADRKLRKSASGMFRNLQASAEVVNVLNDPKTSRSMPDVAAIVNGRNLERKRVAQECLTRHGQVILDAEINRTVLGQALEQNGLKVAKQDIDEEIRRAASSFGYFRLDGSVDVDAWLKQIVTEEKVTVDSYVRDVVWPTVALKKLVGEQVQVSEEDLAKGFDANYGPRVEVMAIVVGNQRTAYEVFEMARNNPTDKFFGELANQYSIEPVSKSNYGTVPPIRRNGGRPLLESEAFGLEPGELSGVVAQGDKYIILRCLGRTKPIVTEMAAVKDELQADIREKKLRLAMSTEFDRLKLAAQIDNFLSKTTQPGQRIQAAVPASFETEPGREASRPAERRR